MDHECGDRDARLLGGCDADEPLVEPLRILAAQRSGLAGDRDIAEQRLAPCVPEGAARGAALGNAAQRAAQRVGDVRLPDAPGRCDLRHRDEFARNVAHARDPMRLDQLAVRQRRSEPRGGQRRKERAREPRAESVHASASSIGSTLPAGCPAAGEARRPTRSISSSSARDACRRRGPRGARSTGCSRSRGLHRSSRAGLPSEAGSAARRRPRTGSRGSGSSPARRAGRLAQHRGRGHDLHQRGRRVGAGGRESWDRSRRTRRPRRSPHPSQSPGPGPGGCAPGSRGPGPQAPHRPCTRPRADPVPRAPRRGCRAGAREARAGAWGSSPRRRRLALLDPGVQRPGVRQRSEKAQQREDVARQDDPQNCEPVRTCHTARRPGDASFPGRTHPGVTPRPPGASSRPLFCPGPTRLLRSAPSERSSRRPRERSRSTGGR